MACSVCCDETSSPTLVCACERATCRRCYRKLACEGDALDCLWCGRSRSAAERTSLLGKTFYSTTFRRARGWRLFEREQLKFASDAPAVEAERMRRARAKLLQEARRTARSGDAAALAALDTLRLDHGAARSEGVAAPPSFAFKCGACTGMVFSDGRCSSCDRRHCMLCREPATEGHVCDPAARATLAAIRNECRPCAGCSAPCYRVEGCHVVWCIACHTFWNWSTGRVLPTRGRVPHNPDHVQWMQTNRLARRHVDDIPCGGIPTLEMLQASFHTLTDLRFASAPTVHGIIEHILRGFRMACASGQRCRRIFAREGDVDALRVSYLLGDRTPAQLRAALEAHERRDLWRRDVLDVLDAFVFSMTDTLQLLCAGEASLTQTCFSCARIQRIAQAAMKDVARDHGRKTPEFMGNGRVRVPYERR